jgi:hypothetical protein
MKKQEHKGRCLFTKTKTKLKLIPKIILENKVLKLQIKV